MMSPEVSKMKPDLKTFLKENFFTRKAFPPIHPLKADKHGAKKEIPAAIVLPLTCFPPTRLNSMKRRKGVQNREEKEQITYNLRETSSRIESAKILHNRG
jgi:hypothetical protein